MFRVKEPPIIISIGGSLVAPKGGLNIPFLIKLNKFIRAQVAKGKKFFLVTGGGQTARHYIEAGRGVIGDITNTDLDWLGIHSTRLNAHLLRTIFQDIAHPRIIENYDRKLNDWREPVVICSGWKPGWSTDYDAVILARDYKANVVINLSNIDWVYDKDPKKHRSAKAIKKITWDQMEKLVGTTWVPGSNLPFDPIAAKLAESLQLTVIIANGTKFGNLRKIIEGEAFVGTVITPFKIDASFYDREYYSGKKGGALFKYTESWSGNLFQNIANFYRAALIAIFLHPKSALDVGCGTGYLVKWLRFFGIEAFGVEISQDALDLAHEDVKKYLKWGDIANLPYDENQFDVVIVFDVLEHLERSKIKKAIAETTRVARKFVLNKLYTTENLYITYFHGRDFSQLSVFPQKYWKQLFNENQDVSVLRGSFFRLPLFFETIFLLKKKTS